MDKLTDSLTSQISKLEGTIVDEVLRRLKKKGKRIFIVFDERKYQEMRRDSINEDTFYILCNNDWSLSDIRPFLELTSSKKRKRYLSLRKQLAYQHKNYL